MSVATNETELQRPLGPSSWLVGFVAMGFANGVISASKMRATLGVRTWFHLYDILHFALLGLAAMGIAWAVRRATSKPHATWLATTAVAVAVGLLLLPPDLRGPAARLQVSTGLGGLAPVLAMCTAILVPTAEATGRRLGRTRLRWAALGVVLATAPLNLSIFTHRLPGAHFFLAWGTAALIAGAFHEFTPPRLPSDRVTRLVLAMATTLGLASVAFPMPSRPSTLMNQMSGSVLYPFVARAHAARLRAWLPDPMPQGPWYSPREDVPPVSPSSPALEPKPQILIVLSIDAMRADVLTDPVKAAAMPHLSKLRDRGAFFTSAWAPSNATVSSLGSMFTGKYYSQLYWSELEDDPGGEDLWPHGDESVRFPALLSAAGVRTVTYAPAYWLVNRFGVVGGFDDEAYIPARRSVGPRRSSLWASAGELFGRLRRRLRHVAKAADRSTFFFIHVLEPHYPYNQGNNDSEDDASRYLTELSVVDERIGELVHELERLHVADRTMLIVISDHGEAFGEHSTQRHGSTLYDEVTRVPLLFVGPGIAPRVVDTPVSLMDVGPTILDIYGLPTPGAFMGQTLLPALQGERLELSRPIMLEARPLQAMVFPNRIKVIRDRRLGILEVYDLNEDPDELDNLYDGFGESLRDHFGPLAAFFHVHELRREGYEVMRR